MLKKVAAINDLSGIGKCSLSAALPILSALKVQCCPLPTAILSSQTGFDEYTFLDLTNEMEEYYTTWKNLNLNIDTKRLKINMNEEGGEIHSKYVIGLDGQEGITTILDIKIQVN